MAWQNDISPPMAVKWGLIDGAAT